MIDTSARLIRITYTGELGRMNRTEVEIPVFCQLASVDRREYFAAYNSGFRPEWRVTLDPVNFTDETLISIDAPGGTVLCDIYRTYRKSADVMELWVVKHNPQAVQTFTLWTAGKCVTLFGCYLTGSDGVTRTETGANATDTVSLILPQTFLAYCGEIPVGYTRPKAYARMPDEEKAEHFTIDERCFFALGRLETVPGQFLPEGAEGLITSEDKILYVLGCDAAGMKYQEVNGLADDVYLVQSVALKNKGRPDTEYLEVVGR